MTVVAMLDELHARVREDYRAKVLKEAATICLDGLTSDPDQPPLLNLRGLLASDQGQHETALACHTRAADLDPLNAAYAADSGDALLRVGRYADAEAAFRRAIALAGQSADILCRLARTVSKQGRLAEAVQICEDARQLDLTRVATHIELGDLLCAQGRDIEGLPLYERSIALDPQVVDGYLRLGRLHLRRGDNKLALDTFRRGVETDAGNADLYVGIGDALIRLGLFDAATEALRHALMLAPTNVAACRQFALLMELTAARDTAASAWFSLGHALKAEQRLLEAAVAYRQALSRKPNHLGSHVELGDTYLELAQPKSAVRQLEKALAIEPEHTAAHGGVGSASAVVGNLERIFDEIAWFDRYGPWKRRYLDRPTWDGAPLDGKTIVLWTNAGLGDTILMARFAQLVKALGARVLLECDRTLAHLLESIPLVDGVIPRLVPLPAFDYHALMASVPRTLQTRIATIPNQPYLSVDAELTEAWRRRLGSTDETRVGVVWAADAGRGGSPIKSVTLTTLAPLGRVPDVHFVSLQLGPAAADLLAPPRGLRMQRILNESVTAADTAAVIMNLDLVITVDTMVAHLAGALGRPTWTLLRYAPAWMWLLDDDRSPWYPTMRLFRQTRPGDWTGVVERLQAALTEMVRSAAR